MTKVCTGCRKEKTLDGFGPHPKGKFGKQPRCYECRRTWHKEFYADNKHLWKDREDRMREEDPEALKKKNRDAAARWRADPENVRKKKMAYIESRYGIKYSEYEALERSQGGLCAICRRSPTNTKYGRLHVDHDHRTDKVRGLLCHTCNAGLGQFQDRVDWLRAGIEYLLAVHGDSLSPQCERPDSLKIG